MDRALWCLPSGGTRRAQPAVCGRFTPLGGGRAVASAAVGVRRQQSATHINSLAWRSSQTTWQHLRRPFCHIPASAVGNRVWYRGHCLAGSHSAPRREARGTDYPCTHFCHRKCVLFYLKRVFSCEYLGPTAVCKLFQEKTLPAPSPVPRAT